MKRIILLVLTFFCITFRATSVVIGGLSYSLESDEAMLDNNNRNWDGELVIPSEVEYEGKTYTVTKIAWLAFNHCTTLSKVTIPHTITEIWHYAGYEACKNPFDGCVNLERIDVDEENPSMCSEDGVLFSKDKTQLYAYPGGDKRETYVVPANVVWIGGDAFSGNPYLKNVEFANKHTKCFFGTFANCANLERVVLPEEMTHIGAAMFSYCKSLQSIVIPSGVKTMAEQIFIGCSSLASIALPEGLTSVGSLAFKDCSSLKTVTLPSSLREVSHGMFGGCSSLSDITLTEGPKTIYMSAFANCTSLKTLDLPQSVNRIDQAAFTGCSLDTLIIRGVLDRNYLSGRSFEGMGKSSIIYARQSEIDKIKKVYTGNVLPLDSYTAIHDLSSPEMVIGQSSDGKWYDLSGRRLSVSPASSVPSVLPKGVYIRDGRKVLMK